MANPVVLTPQQIALITERTQLQNEIKLRETRELAIRNELVMSGIFPSLLAKEEGSQTIHITQYPGWTMTAKRIKNYNMTNKKGETVAALVALSAVNLPTAQNIVSWKPVIAEGAFRKLSKLEQEIFTAALTITPGTPQLEINPPTEAYLKEQAELANA